MPSKITLLYIMPAPHAGMPLFTTWYALIPSIILCVTGGIRPYAPRHVCTFWPLFRATPPSLIPRAADHDILRVLEYMRYKTI